MADERQERVNTLISNILDFLENEGINLAAEKREALEVAIQCIQSAFDLDETSREHLTRINLLDLITLEPLEQVVDEEKAEAFKHLGNMAMKAGNYEEAISHYTEAIKFNGRNAVYYGNRAAAYTRLDRNNEAITDCRRAILIDPKYGKAYGRLGIAYSNLHMYEEARNAYRAALEYDPQNRMYQENMKIAEECIFATMERAAPPEHRPHQFREFVNSEGFLTVARELVNAPDFNNLMSGIMAMGQSGNINFETLLQAGQSLAYQLQEPDPALAERLASQVSAPSVSTGTPRSEDSTDPLANESANGTPRSANETGNEASTTNNLAEDQQ